MNIQILDRFYREPQVLEIFPMCRVTLWRKIKAGEFPPGQLISKRIRAWKGSELQAFMDRLQEKGGIAS